MARPQSSRDIYRDINSLVWPEIIDDPSSTRSLASYAFNYSPPATPLRPVGINEAGASNSLPTPPSPASGELSSSRTANPLPTLRNSELHDWDSSIPAAPSRQAAFARAHASQSTPTAVQPYENDDLLALFATERFSSPSILHSSSPARPPTQHPDVVHNGGHSLSISSDRSSGTGQQPTQKRRGPLDLAQDMPRTRRQSSGAGASSRQSGPNSYTAVPGAYPESNASGSSPLASPTQAPTSLKRTRPHAAVPGFLASASASFTTASSSSSSSRSSRPPQNARKRPRIEETIDLGSDLFDSDTDGVEIIDLASIDRPANEGRSQAEEEDNKDEAEEESPQEPAPPEDRVRFGSIQCVICLDFCAALTVTHCGHVFCSECLHSSLHIESSRKNCPVCRQRVEVRPTSSAAKLAKSYFHLELKLMTRNRQGKQPAR